MPRFDWRLIFGTIIALIVIAFAANAAGIRLPKPLND